MTDTTSGFRDLDAVTGKDLQAVTFTHSKGFGRGFDQLEVDAFVVRCAEVVEHLRRTIQDRDATIFRQQERIDKDSRSNEVAHAISVLTQAQQTADKTVMQADDYSARVMSEARDLYEDARRNAATLEQETEDKARHVYEDALSRSAALERETEQNLALLTLSAATAQKELESQTAYLRTLRDATRTQMEAFLEGLLDHVADAYGRAHPMAAEAANASAPRRARKSNRLAGRTGGAGKNPAAGLRVAGLPAGRRGQDAGDNAGIPYPRSAPSGENNRAYQVDGYLQD